MFDALMWLVLAIVFIALPISIILLIIRAIKKKPVKKILKTIGVLFLAALVLFIAAMFAPDDTPTEETQSTETVESTTVETTTETETTEPTTTKPQCAHKYIEVEYEPDLSTKYASIKSECSLCGKISFASERLSEERMTKYLKEECKTYTYEEIARNPDKHKNEIVTLTGEVIQVQELLGTTTLLVNVTKEGNEYYSYYTDTVYVNYKFSDELKILNGDIITMCGVFCKDFIYNIIKFAFKENILLFIL